MARCHFTMVFPPSAVKEKEGSDTGDRLDTRALAPQLTSNTIALLVTSYLLGYY